MERAELPVQRKSTLRAELIAGRRSWAPRRTRGAPRARSAGMATAAVLGQEADDPRHVLEIGAVNDEAPVLPRARQAGPGEMRQVERQRGGRQFELLADGPGRAPFGSSRDEQAENLEPRLVGEGRERVDDLCGFHISRIVE